jgi:hypothetical protein
MGLSRPGNSISQPAVTVPGAGGGGTDSQGVTATAGSDVATTSDADQALSGGGSNGTAPYSFAWTVQTQPSGATASITSASSQNATLTGISATINGAYICKVVATDASGFTDSATVTIDAQVAASGGGWTDIVNIDFVAASSQALTSGQENTIGSDVFWIDGFNASGSIGITNGVGLQVSFKNQGGGHSGIYLKASGVAKVSDSQDWPRFRICAAISNITYSANSDAIGCEATGYPPNGSTHYVPRLTAQLKRNSGSSMVWKFSVRKGALGTTGTNVGASDVATSEPTSMVIELRERSGGSWDMCAEESTTTIPEAGAMTQVASALQCHTVGRPAQYDYWAEGSNLSGPYLGVNFRSLSNGSQACVIEKLIIQKFI